MKTEQIRKEREKIEKERSKEQRNFRRGKEGEQKNNGRLHGNDK
jgi:hypothetical protein